MVTIEQVLQDLGWRVVHRETRPGRQAQYAPIPEWLPEPLAREVGRRFPKGLYRHQALGLTHFHQGHHVALTTATASGKSLVFYLAGLTLLLRDPETRIAALYPMKALSREQEQRWQGWLERLGLPSAWVQRIDGDVPTKAREAILEQARIVLFTPDVAHAWLLPNANRPAALTFLQRLRLLIVDEVHTYSGVFGSNAAYLFRRWRHLMHLAGNETPQWIVSSATLRDASSHLQQLLGVPCVVLDEGEDTSPQHVLSVLMVESPGDDRFAALGRLLHEIVERTAHRFVAFADSRKQVEFLSTLVRRFKHRPNETANEDDEGYEPRQVQAVLAEEDILPYRAGYEWHDRLVIQQRLGEGHLRGVISTSALELGMDIGHLGLAILVGVPPTMTNLQQRIGRVGRQGPGYVLIVNTGSPQDQALFRRPAEALRRPPAESTLYLENRYLQYIHALCLARNEEGEHDQLCKALGRATNGEEFDSPIAWPPGFLELCREERTGQVSRELRNWAGNVQNQPPQWVFPLRDIEPQFRVELRRRSSPGEARGSLSYYQVLNEAYPGAVYYYASVPYRVQRVYPRSRRIEIRPEKQYRTRPKKYTWLQPNLRTESLFQGFVWGDLLVFEAELTIRERIHGFEEWRGPNKLEMAYPNSYWDFLHFERGYTSTGLVFVHPLLNDLERVRPLAEQLYEAFLLTIPVDRQEIGWETGLMAVGYAPYFSKKQRFLALYERVYGGLHLTGRLLEDVPTRLMAMLEATRNFRMDHETAGDGGLFEAWLDALQTYEPRPLSFDPWQDAPAGGQDGRVRVIVPGSRGYVVREGQHVEVLIRSIFYNPNKGLMYKGLTCVQYLYDPPERNSEMRFTREEVQPIPGLSCLGWYDVEIGEVVPDAEQDCRPEDDCWSATASS